MTEFIKTQMLLGTKAMEKLNNSSVAIFGIGGVGSYVCEALARCGVGNLTFIDNDKVSISNINRQIIALHSTIGEYKTNVMKNRAKDINPDINVKTYNIFYSSENSDILDFSQFDYIVDAIDTVSSKLHIIEKAYKMNIPTISSMGTGNKLDPSRFKITDISKTKICPLARVMRRELKKRNISKLKVLWSDEEPIKPEFLDELHSQKRSNPASVAFVPSVAGLLIAKEVVCDLIK